MKTILLLNGPNLNRLGTRDPKHYGSTPLLEIEQKVRSMVAESGFELDSFQSNHEGALIDRIYEAADDKCSGILFNPGAYAHTSVALRDAIEAAGVPVVEIHLSNVSNRESFRHKSFIMPVSIGQVSGFGPESYLI